MKVTVVGIGQRLCGDDAAGLEAVRQWRQFFPETASRPEVQVEECELPGLGLLDVLDGSDAALFVDATLGSTPPGSIQCLGERELSAFAPGSKFAHGWGLAETLQLGHSLKKITTDIRIIGIEAEQMEKGAGLSKSVAAAMPMARNTIQAEINKILG